MLILNNLRCSVVHSKFVAHKIYTCIVRLVHLGLRIRWPICTITTISVHLTFFQRLASLSQLDRLYTYSNIAVSNAVYTERFVSPYLCTAYFLLGIVTLIVRANAFPSFKCPRVILTQPHVRLSRLTSSSEMISTCLACGRKRDPSFDNVSAGSASRSSECILLCFLIFFAKSFWLLILFAYPDKLRMCIM